MCDGMTCSDKQYMQQLKLVVLVDKTACAHAARWRRAVTMQHQACPGTLFQASQYYYKAMQCSIDAPNPTSVASTAKVEHGIVHQCFTQQEYAQSLLS